MTPSDLDNDPDLRALFGDPDAAPVAAGIEAQAAAYDPRLPRHWRLRPMAELLAQPAPTRWLIRGILEQATIACLFGASGVGKSFLTVDLSACVATGTPWHGHAVTQGAVVYLAGEGHNGLARRFLAWGIAHDVDLAAAPLHVSSAAISLTDVDAAAAVVDAVHATGAAPALIVIDTLNAHLSPGADENETAIMGALTAAADALRHAFDAAVLIVHHVGHAAQNRERGASNLRPALDWSYLAARSADGPLILSCAKSKDHEEPAPKSFYLRRIELPWRDDEDKPETSAVLSMEPGASMACGASLAAALLAKADAEHVLSALRQACDMGATVHAAREGPATCHRVLSAYSALPQHLRDSRTRFFAGLDCLLSEGAAIVEEYRGKDRHPRRRIVPSEPECGSAGNAGDPLNNPRRLPHSRTRRAEAAAGCGAGNAGNAGVHDSRTTPATPANLEDAA